MTRPDSDRHLGGVVGRAIPDGLLDEILEDSARRAADILRDRVTAAMVDELESLLHERLAAPAGGATAAGAKAGAPTAPGAVTGWYLYGVTRSTDVESMGAVTGIGDAPVEVVTVGRLAAVVSRVTGTDRWGLDPRGDVDLEAIAPLARRHEGVLEEMLGRGPVIPLRFGVLYPDLDRVRRMLGAQADRLLESLDHVQGQEEWGLTIVAEAAADERISPPEGREYLSRRKEQRIAAEARRQATSDEANRIHDKVLEIASDVVFHANGTSRPDGGYVVFKASYLVPRSESAVFRAEAETALSAAPPELRLSGELTGPWPAYHFSPDHLEEVSA